MKKKVNTKRAKLTKSDANGVVPSADGSKNGKAKPVNYDEFVKTWRDSSTVFEVAETMGITRNSASAIAARLRKEGVALRIFPRRVAQPIDVKHLNKISAGKV